MGRDGMWYGRWVVIWGVSMSEGKDKGELRLDG